MNIISITRNNTKPIILMLLLAVLLTNCNNKLSDDAFDDLPPGSLTIVDAKQWFDANLQPVINANLVKQQNNNETVIDLKPVFNWNLAEILTIQIGRWWNCHGNMKARKLA